MLGYRELVESPDHALNRVFGFLGVEGQEIEQIPADNSGAFVTREGSSFQAHRDSVKQGSAT